MTFPTQESSHLRTVHGHHDVTVQYSRPPHATTSDKEPQQA